MHKFCLPHQNQSKVFSGSSLVQLVYSHVSRSRVSWVLREASSWAEYKHKWCFHSTLISAVWILPQALISMAAAFSLIQDLCNFMCLCTHTFMHFLSVWLKHPFPASVEFSCLHSFSPNLDFSDLLLLAVTSLTPLHSCLFSWFFSGSFVIFSPVVSPYFPV